MRDEFEQELKENLKRTPAPDGFADRVMDRVARKEPLRFKAVPPRRVWHVWQTAIAALALIGASIGVVEAVHQRQERRQAEIVQRQFDVAMQITEKTLDGVSERISRAGTKQEMGDQ